MKTSAKITSTLLIILATALLMGCKGELTQEKALEQLKALPEFRTPFYAPFGIGKELLSGDDHENPDKYINQHLGELIKAGLVEAKITDKNSWRSVMTLSLTEQGKKYADPSRSNDKSVYVMVCTVTPTRIDEIKEITPDEVFQVKYTFAQSDVTPFGTHMEFSNGKTYSDMRTFVRSGRGWKIE